jgi:outer membrane protein assembly factor BamB
VRWKVRADGYRFYAPLVHQDATILALADNDYVYSLTASGALRWRYRLGGPAYPELAVGSDGSVYISSGGIRVVSSDGTRSWWASVDGRTETQDEARPVVAADGTVYIGGEDYQIHAVSGDGQILWSFQGYDSPLRGLTLAGESILYRDSFRERMRDEGAYRSTYLLVSVSAQTGAFEWAVTLNDELVGNPWQSADGTIYCQSCDNTVYALSPRGDVLWSRPIALGTLVGTPTTTADGLVLLGCEEGVVLALDRQGELVWSVATDAYLTTGPVVDRRGRCYIGGTAIVCLDPGGRVRWRYDGFRDTVDGIATDAGDQVVFSADRLYALTSSGDLAWAFRTEENLRISSSIFVGDGLLCADLGYDDVSLITTSGVVVDQVNLFTERAVRPYDTSGNLNRDILARSFLTEDGICIVSDAIRIHNFQHGIDELLFRPTSGKIRWCCPAADGNGVFLELANKDAAIYQILSLEGPVEKWRRSMPEPSWPAVLAPGGLLGLIAGTRTLCAISPHGEIAWQHEIAEEVVRALRVVSDRMFLVLADSPDPNNIHHSISCVYAVSLSGTVLWRTSIGSPPGIYLLAPSGGPIYVGNTRGTLFVLSLEGALLREIPAPLPQIMHCPLVDGNGLIYYGQQDTIYAVSNEGERVWQFNAGAGIASDLSLGADGTLYFGTEDGYLYALGEQV